MLLTSARVNAICLCHSMCMQVFLLFHDQLTLPSTLQFQCNAADNCAMVVLVHTNSESESLILRTCCPLFILATLALVVQIRALFMAWYIALKLRFYMVWATIDILSEYGHHTLQGTYPTPQPLLYTYLLLIILLP
jgi:hypothetical protein